MEGRDGGRGVGLGGDIYMDGWIDGCFDLGWRRIGGYIYIGEGVNLSK